MKKYSVFIFIMLFALILSGCSNNILENTETGKTGPAWDVTMKVPVADSQNNFGDLVGIKEFSDFGFSIDNNNNVSFNVVGTETKPIGNSLEVELPELEITRNEPFFKEDTPEIPIGGEGIETIEIPFEMLEGFVFANSNDSSFNKMNIKVENTGDNSLEDFRVNVLDENNNSLEQLDYDNLASNSSERKAIDFNDKEIDYSTLILEISYKQNTANATSAKIMIEGFQNLKVVKAKDIDGDIATELNFSQNVDIGDAGSINSYDYNEDGEIENAEFKFQVDTSGVQGLEFNFSNSELDSNVFGSKNADGDYSVDSANSLNLGEFVINSSIDTINSDGTFSYDSSKKIKVNYDMIGQVELSNPFENENDYFEVENYSLLYKAEPMKIELTEENIEKIEKYILSEDSFLETEVNNGLDIDLKADIYLANSNDKNELYVDNNKVNNSLVEIRSGDSEPKRFSLGELDDEKSFLNLLDRAINNGENIYLGIEFLIGEIDSENSGTTKKTYSFTDDQNIDIKSHLELTVKVNQ